MAAEGATACNFLFGGIHPETDEPYAHYHFEASGWGGRPTATAQSAQNHVHGNCRNTPVEVFETRFPFRTLAYGLIPDSGGPGRHRGGLAVRRDLEVLAPEITASAMLDRVERGAWGLFGGKPGRCAALLVRRAGDGPVPGLLRGVRHGQPVEARGRRAARGRRRAHRERGRRRLRRPARARPATRRARRARGLRQPRSCGTRLRPGGGRWALRAGRRW